MDAVNVSAALHRLGSCRLAPGQLRVVVGDPGFEDLKARAGVYVYVHVYVCVHQ